MQEDTSLEASFAFGGRALCISSGGETAFDLLLGGAKDVVAIDVNPAQTVLVHLKASLFRHLPFSEINDAFTKDGRPAYQKLKSRLPKEVTDYFDSHLSEISKGLIHSGKIDRDMAKAMKLFQTFVHSRKKLERLVTQPTIEDQASYFADNWNTSRLRLGLKLAFSPIVLRRIFGNQLGGLAPKEFGEQVRKELEHVLTTVPLEDNPYVSQIFFGTYPEDSLPPWLTEFGHHRMAQVISRLGLETADVTDWMLRQPEPIITLVCLSNALDASTDAEKSRLVNALSRVLVPGGHVVARSLFHQPIGLEVHSAGRLKRVEISDWVDRSLICRNVEVYRWSTN